MKCPVCKVNEAGSDRSALARLTAGIATDHLMPILRDELGWGERWLAPCRTCTNSILEAHQLRHIKSVHGYQPLYGTDATIDVLRCEKCGYEEWD